MKDNNGKVGCFVIVVSTDIATDAGYLFLQDKCKGLPETLLYWSIDLGDADKVLRLVAKTDISNEIIQMLSEGSVSATVMAVFYRNEKGEASVIWTDDAN